MMKTFMNLLEGLGFRDLLTYVQYYDHQIKCFHKLSSSTNTLIGQVKYLLKTRIQFRRSEPYHQLLWIKDAPKYGVNGNDKM